MKAFRLMFLEEYTPDLIIQLDIAVFEAQAAFNRVPEYEGFYKPKHHFATHASINTMQMGPMKGLWCYSFEGFHQRVKRIAEGSNFKNVSKRIIEFFCVQFGMIMHLPHGSERSRIAGLCQWIYSPDHSKGLASAPRPGQGIVPCIRQHWLSRLVSAHRSMGRRIPKSKNTCQTRQARQHHQQYAHPLQLSKLAPLVQASWQV